MKQTISWKIVLYSLFLLVMPLISAQTTGSPRITMEIITIGSPPTPDIYHQNGNTVITHRGQAPTKDTVVDALLKEKKVSLNINLSQAKENLHHMVRVVTFNTTILKTFIVENQTVNWHQIGVYDPATNATVPTIFQDNTDTKSSLIFFGGVWSLVEEQFNMFGPQRTNPKPLRILPAPFFDA